MSDRATMLMQTVSIGLHVFKEKPRNVNGDRPRPYVSDFLLHT